MPQNEMLVVEEIKEANTFGVSADTTPDLSKRDQMATVFRYVNANGDAKEKVLFVKAYISVLISLLVLAITKRISFYLNILYLGFGH